jgi:hypothetical protein
MSEFTIEEIIPLEWCDNAEFLEIEKFIDHQQKLLKNRIKDRNKKRMKHNLKRSRDMGIDLNCYEKLDISEKDRRKKPRKSNMRKPIPFVNFSYPEGLNKILNESYGVALNLLEITSIGKKKHFWDHKIQKNLNGQCQIKSSISFTLRKMTIKKEISVYIYNGIKYFRK